MKLWLLNKRLDLPKGDDPWYRSYDMYYGFVIRAETEEQARAMAENERADETKGAWLHENFSTCEEITAQGDAEIILRDFNAG